MIASIVMSQLRLKEENCKYPFRKFGAKKKKRLLTVAIQKIENIQLRKKIFLRNSFEIRLEEP